MKKVLFSLPFIIAAAAAVVFLTFAWQTPMARENSPANSTFDSKFQSRKADDLNRRDSQIKGIQLFGGKSGIAFTGEALFQTSDDGRTWREIFLPRDPTQKISAVCFRSEQSFRAVLADKSELALAISDDGGETWEKRSINLPDQYSFEADLENPLAFRFNDRDKLILVLRAQTSSNFDGRIYYESLDDGKTWEIFARSVELRNEDSAAEKTAGNWRLKTDGSCAGFKTGCVQETKIFAGEKEITPPQIKELAAREKANAKLQAENSIFAQPDAAAAPGGAVRTSLNRGFDKCTAATVAQMQAWWNNSPFYDANIYISGRNRGCAQPQLTAAWVTQVSAMGWGLIPTIVGYQAPCSSSTNAVKHSSDPAVAEQQGRDEADIAITDANNLGLTQGTVLYYDMERYDETAQTPGCRTAVKAFLKGWTERVKERGYVSGVYGSPTNAVADWISLPEPSRMDAVWLARWDNVPSVWVYNSPSPIVPTDVWNNRQRIKQYQAPHNETWGGVTFNIDGNIAEGPVAGARAAKNKPADFDGDGRTDISVFRPETGSWFVLSSSNSNFFGVAFGTASDVLAPGDFDGDGKTDFAVFRPENGTWYIQLRTSFRAQQFGTAGDVPVPADYNGDGFTDIAVFRPSNGYWYILNSSGAPATQFRAEQFGTSGDRPVPGDFDGDGKSDLAVYRPSNGTWYLMQSRDGFAGAQFGVAADRPAQADYDGDGKTDLGVYRDGVWFLWQSQQGFGAAQFGIASDRPAPGDFDGDGKSDLAVYRDGTWYLLQTTSGFAGLQFGVAADRPVPSAYVPQN
jgi:hypothetical protein